jgi:NADPH-dependent curcumin reductase CurA
MTRPQQKWIYTRRPEGTESVSSSHYTLEESAAPSVGDLQDGEILVEALYLSVDPYMRIQQAASNTWEQPHPLGAVQGSGSVVQVIHSKSSAWKVGSIALGYTG